MDHMELERQRGITIQSASTYTFWRDHVINLIDTPGHVDFTVEVERALRVLDGAILVLCAVGGVQSQTLTVTRQMNRYSIPRIGFINKLDRLGANHLRVLEQIRDKVKKNACFVNIPIGLESKNTGIIDLVDQKALYFDEPMGLTLRTEEIPKEMLAESIERRQELIESLADVDDELGELFLSEKAIDSLSIKRALKRCTINHSFMPVMVGTALRNKGVQPLLDGIVDYLPNPGEVKYHALDESIGSEQPIKVPLNSKRSDENPFLGLAFKLEASKYGQLTYVRAYQGQLTKGETLINTRNGKKIRISRLGRINVTNFEDMDSIYAGDIAALFGVDCASGDTFVKAGSSIQNLSMESMFVPDPVVSMSITPTNSKTIEGFSKGLARFTKEDPTFKLSYDEESGSAIVSGMGELHLEIYAQRLEKEYNAPCVLGKPKVAFRETIVEPFQFDYLHKKQSGGAGQYGKVIGVIEPLKGEDNVKLKFVDKTTGTNIPKNYIGAIETGFRKTCERGGFLAGQRVAGLKFVLLDGAHHHVDSSDWAFQQAAEGAVNQAMDNGTWILLEPVMFVEAVAPQEFQNAIISALTKRNGIIINSKTEENNSVVEAEVPLNDMFGFVGQLRGLTEGKGEYTMEFSKYCPARTETTDTCIREFEEKIDEQQNKSTSGTSKKSRKK
ncbi:elongation factor EF-G [Cichlidogyrus casuarinus]|uniref:Elongation factor EF-G n=1 Tax=Cichlidogyrus casuarinus TaxID=1844966 RepID=A0ABD2QEX0_9PLAT